MMRLNLFHERAARRNVSSTRECRRSTHVWLGSALLAVAAVAVAQPCHAYDVMLRWTVPSNTTGYRVHTGSGPGSGTYSQHTNVGLPTGSTLNGIVYYRYQGLQAGSRVYVAVTAYNSAGLESAYSNEKVFDYDIVNTQQVNAGLDKSAAVGDSVVIGVSGQLGLSYFWEQVAGPPATLSSRTSSNPRITSSTAGTFTFALTAYDVRGIAARDLVTVTLTGNGAPDPTPVPDSAFIRGNRRRPKSDRSGCQVEWLVAGATKTMDRYGLPSLNQTCRDGDPNCDYRSETPGLCEFRVQVCFNNADPGLPACTPAGISTVRVLAPRLPSLNATDGYELLAANLDALQSAISHLRDPGSAEAGYVYEPPLDETQQGFCSAPFAVAARVVTRGSRPSATLKTRTSNNSPSSRRVSVSELRLSCTPPTN